MHARKKHREHSQVCIPYNYFDAVFLLVVRHRRRSRGHTQTTTKKHTFYIFIFLRMQEMFAHGLSIFISYFCFCVFLFSFGAFGRIVDTNNNLISIEVKMLKVK